MRVCPDCLTQYDDSTETCGSDGTDTVDVEDSEDPRVGSVVEDRFLVTGMLGEGGMGVVYRAMQLSTQAEVALKVLHPTYAAKAGVAKRFVREARVTAGLRSPHTITVHDFGELGGGELYLAMELLGGLPGDDLIAMQGALESDRVRTILMHMCISLHEAHEKGLVHRDLKPGNVMIEQLPDGSDFAKVLDFGVAKVLDAGATMLTASGAVVGTPAYMSPEQALGKAEITRSADIYATGIMGFHLLTGRLPFERDGNMQLMLAHVGDPPPTLASRGFKKAPYPHWERILHKALEKDPADRYPSAHEMYAAIAEIPKTRGTAMMAAMGGAAAGGMGTVAGQPMAAGAEVGPQVMQPGGATMPFGVSLGRGGGTVVGGIVPSSAADTVDGGGRATAPGTVTGTGRHTRLAGVIADHSSNIAGNATDVAPAPAPKSKLPLIAAAVLLLGGGLAAGLLLAGGGDPAPQSATVATEDRTATVDAAVAEAVDAHSSDISEVASGLHPDAAVATSPDVAVAAATDTGAQPAGAVSVGAAADAAVATANAPDAALAAVPMPSAAEIAAAQQRAAAAKAAADTAAAAKAAAAKKAAATAAAAKKAALAANSGSSGNGATASTTTTPPKTSGGGVRVRLSIPIGDMDKAKALSAAASIKRKGAACYKSAFGASGGDAVTVYVKMSCAGQVQSVGARPKTAKSNAVADCLRAPAMATTFPNCTSGKFAILKVSLSR